MNNTINFLNLAEEILNSKESQYVSVFINPYYFLDNGTILNLGFFSKKEKEKLAEILEDANKYIFEKTGEDYITGHDWLDVFESDRLGKPI